MTEVVVQADIGGMTIAFTDIAGKADLDEKLDVFTKSIGRQKAKIELSEKLLALQVNDRMLSLLPERETAMLKTRAEEKARLRASFEASHSASGRRAEYRPNAAQEKGLEQFDEQTGIERDRIAREKRDLERDRPIIEAQISRLRAVVAGRDPTEYVPERAAEAA